VENIWSTTGTSYQGEIRITYQDLVKTLGRPNGKTDGYKIDAEWEIKTPFGMATIYNWKDGKNYLGPTGQALTDITEWHIGGHTKEVVSYVYNLWPEKALELALHKL